MTSKGIVGAPARPELHCTLLGEQCMTRERIGQIVTQEGYAALWRQDRLYLKDNAEGDDFAADMGSALDVARMGEAALRRHIMHCATTLAHHRDAAKYARGYCGVSR